MHPVLIEIGRFQLPTYGLFVALGMLAGVSLAVYRARRMGVDENLILDMAFWGFVVGMLGARLTYIVLNFEYFLRDPASYIFSRQGFVFGGGMLFALPLVLWLVRRGRARGWLVADCFAPAIPLGHALGRIGCFFAGCCWGKVCHLPWAVTFPRIVGPEGELIGFAHAQQAMEGLVAAEAAHSLPVHPTQLYEAAALGLICLAVLWVDRRKRFEGQSILAYLFLYPLGRFIIEFFRGDVDRGLFFGLSTSQIISVAAFTAAAVCWWRLRRRPAAK